MNFCVNNSLQGGTGLFHVKRNKKNSKEGGGGGGGGVEMSTILKNPDYSYKINEKKINRNDIENNDDDFIPKIEDLCQNGGGGEGGHHHHGINYLTKNFNEFNASNFNPSFMDYSSRIITTMPYLTIREKRSRKFDENSREKIKGLCSSLTDLSYDNLKCVEVLPFKGSDGCLDNGGNNVGFSPESGVNNSPDKTIIKNKNLKILKTLSPFVKKKKTNHPINIYQINVPKNIKSSGEDLNLTNIDYRLSNIYRNRGMYAYDKDSKKIVFYPPEYFLKNYERGGNSRQRLNSRNSSLSCSSLDSEDIKQIGDVAL